MNIKFSSGFLIKNFQKLSDILANDVSKSFVITKDNDEKFDLRKNEVILFKVYNSKFERNYTKLFNKKHQHMQENRVVRTTKNEKDLVSCDIYISNKYIHLLFGKTLESINLSKITESYIDPKYITIYTTEKAYMLVLNDIKYSMQLVFLVDVLKNVKLDDSLVGKNINVEINK